MKKVKHKTLECIEIILIAGALIFLLFYFTGIVSCVPENVKNTNKDVLNNTNQIGLNTNQIGLNTEQIGKNTKDIEDLKKTVKIIDGKVYTLEGELLNQGKQIESLDELATMTKDTLVEHFFYGKLSYRVNYDEKTLWVNGMDNPDVAAGDMLGFDYIIPDEILGYKVVGLSKNDFSHKRPPLPCTLYLPNNDYFYCDWLPLMGELHFTEKFIENNQNNINWFNDITPIERILYIPEESLVLFGNLFKRTAMATINEEFVGEYDLELVKDGVLDLSVISGLNIELTIIVV